MTTNVGSKSYSSMSVFFIFRVCIPVGFILILKANLSAQGNWIEDSTTGFSARRFPASVAIAGKIFVIGGTPTGTLQIFDPSIHKWTTPMTSGSEPTDGTVVSASVIYGNIYVIEKYHNTNIDTIKSFDPRTNIWTSISSTGLHTPREGFTSTVLNNKIYLIGGIGPSGFVVQVDVFDPINSKWSTLTTTGVFTPRYEFTSCAVGKKIYILGGIDSTYDHLLNSLQIFDPATNSWSEGPPMPFPRANLTCCVADGKIYAIGGNIFPAGASSSYLQAVDIFDPNLNIWEGGPNLLIGKSSFSSVVIGKQIFAIGGFRPHQELNDVEVLNLSAQSVTITSQRDLHLSAVPNPTTGIIRIDNTPTNVFAVSVMNVLGETLLKLSNPISSNLTLDLTKLPRGTYFVRLESAMGVVMKKVVKE